MPDETKKWQDHPVVIAVGSGAAALIFAQTVIFPTMTASLQNEVSSARSQMQDVAALKEQLKSATAETAKIKLDLKAAQLNNVFSLGNPYPIGLNKVKLGDGLDAIPGNFPEQTISKTTPGYWSVKLDNGAFREVSYFFDRPKNLKERKVRTILFFTTDRLSGVIRDKLIEALGTPQISGPRPDCAVWSIAKDLFVRAAGSNSFSIDLTQPDCAVEEK